MVRIWVYSGDKVMKNNTIVMRIMSGQSEQCSGEDCPMFKHCWNEEEINKKNGKDNRNNHKTT